MFASLPNLLQNLFLNHDECLVFVDFGCHLLLFALSLLVFFDFDLFRKSQIDCGLPSVGNVGRLKAKFKVPLLRYDRKNVLFSFLFDATDDVASFQRNDIDDVFEVGVSESNDRQIRKML